MDPELKAAIAEITTNFEEFKKKNDERLVLVEKGDHVPAELKEQIGRLETSITDNEAKRDERMAALETAFKRQGQESEKGAEQAAEMKEHQELFRKYMRTGEQGMKSEELQRCAELGQKLLRVSSDPDGGYWVEADTSGSIVERIFETSPLREVASVQDISTDALEGIVDDDEAGAEWVGEQTVPSNEKTPKIGTYRIPTHEQATRPKITQKLLEDSSFNVESWLQGKVVRKFARAENTAFVSGDGAARPRGFLTYPANTLEDYERGKIGQLETAGSGVIVFDDLIDLQGGLVSDFERESTWAFNRRTKAIIRKLKDVDGQYLWTPSLVDGTPEQLLGRGIVMLEDMPDVAANALAVALADWAETYQIVDRVGIAVLRDPFTAKPFVEFYSRRRVGGDVVNFQSIKLLKIQA